MTNLSLTAPQCIFAQPLFPSAPAHIPLTVSALALENGSNTRLFHISGSQSKGPG